MLRFLILATVATAGLTAVVAEHPTAAEVGAAGDPAMGKAQFAQCAICHSVGAAQPDRIGPNLYGIYGARAATRRAGFGYSPALKASRLTWTDAALDRWLTDPAKMVPGTKMAFAGVPRQAVRQNLIAYIKTLK